MIRGGLFTGFFLEDGVRTTPGYATLPAAEVSALMATVRAQWSELARFSRPSESETEEAFIFPVLAALGWINLRQQEPGHGRRDIADALLFLDEDAKARALREPDKPDRFRHGVVVVENEARETRLDRGSGTVEAPSSQILRYLKRAEGQSDGAVRWGLLTNGRFWRLYWSGARTRAEGFVEIDLAGLVGDLPPAPPKDAPPDHWLRVFLLLFGRDALRPEGPQGRNFLDAALAEGRRYEQRITAALSGSVFDRAFPRLASAIAAEHPTEAAPAALEAAREAALRLLYRLLFILFAEDRDLLPVRHDGYRQYGLRTLREQSAEVADGRRQLSPRARTWWPRLTALFAAIAEGDDAMGLPPYNGGLFDDSQAGLLGRITLPDVVLADVLDAMSRFDDGTSRRWINYRDLAVQQLGGIYERLLERDLVSDGAGGTTLRPNAYARKTTGSYYTPDELVQLILRRAVGPLLAERKQRFDTLATELGHARTPRADRLAALAAADPAEAFVALRVCDPAMGSGHFLVSLVDYLAAEVLDAIAGAPAAVPWATQEAPYRSPLVRRIEALRARLLQEAARRGWPVREDQLDDRHLVRRIILKRVIFGADMNPMAVELAKLSLWLHSFTVGAPLSFLDHHLRVGDSLFGEFVHPVEQDLRARFGFLMNQAVVRARQSAAGMAAVEALTDADLGEVKSSASAFAGVEEATAELRSLLDLYHAARWIGRRDAASTAGLTAIFGGVYGDPAALAQGASMPPPPRDGAKIGRGRAAVDPAEAHASAVALLAQARALAARRRFLHWEAAFPGVWEEWERAEPAGGFDAVIGNPPWDRMKMQEVEWFAARVPAIATAQRASDRKRMVAALRRAGDPVAAAYDEAAATAEAATRVASAPALFATAADKGARDYPLLSGGDVNLYALFVERASRLVRRDGIVGLLVPSGMRRTRGRPRSSEASARRDGWARC